jgi:Na+-driven multidrug efflux pump
MRDGLVIDVRAWWPRVSHWRRILRIGLPAGADMASTFIYTAVVYWSIRHFGADAQAAFGASTRIMQALMMPAMAIALVSGPIAGQNFGAGDFARLHSALHSTLVLSVTPMIAAALLLYVAAGRLLEPFTYDPNVVALGSMYLQISAVVLVARGVIYACSGLLQGLGATLPPLLSSGAALGIFSVAVLWFTRQQDFVITDIWYLSAVVFVLQAMLSLGFLYLDWRRRQPCGSESQAGLCA